MLRDHSVDISNQPYLHYMALFHLRKMHERISSLTARALATTIRPWKVQIHKVDTDLGLSPSLDVQISVNRP